MPDLPNHPPDCDMCQNRQGRGFTTPLTMAFQPIYDLETHQIYAHEALVRPVGGGTAADILAQVTEENRYSFDQQCRKTAIRLAAGLGMTTKLSINFMPNAVYEPAHCIRATIWAAQAYGFPTSQLIFEFTESEPLRDADHVRNIVDSYREMNFTTAIDDFGAGFSGVQLLCDTRTDVVKTDIALTRGIDTDERRQKILGHTVSMLNDLGSICVVEGVESASELQTIQDLGGRYVQGYFLAMPKVEELCDPHDIYARIKGFSQAS